MSERDSVMAEGKVVEYYCFGCRQRIHRRVPKAFLHYRSFCSNAGRTIMMRKVKHPRKKP